MHREGLLLFDEPKTCHVTLYNSNLSGRVISYTIASYYRGVFIFVTLSMKIVNSNLAVTVALFWQYGSFTASVPDHSHHQIFLKFGE